MLAHVLSVLTGFLGPSVIYFAKRRESRFIAFHAKQAMLWHLALFVAMIASIALLMATVLLGVFRPSSALSAGARPPAPPAVFLAFAVVWVVVVAGWLVSAGYAVYLAMQASAGRWARYPIVGRWVERRT